MNYTEIYGLRKIERKVLKMTNSEKEHQFIVPLINSMMQLAMTTGTSQRLGDMVLAFDIIMRRYGKLISH